jgi:PleD family two-component response regulator
VRSHAGSIDVNSAPGRGTRFEILLPCAGAAEVRIPAPPPLIEPLRTEKGSILIVEDEDTLRYSVSRMLRKRGFSVLEAGDGDLAVNLIRARDEEIAVVLLDLTLPGKSSLEVFEELQRTRPGVKVILTSA